MNDIIKKKISYSLKGRRKSASTKKRISQALKGRVSCQKNTRKESANLCEKSVLAHLLTNSPPIHLHAHKT